MDAAEPKQQHLIPATGDAGELAEHHALNNDDERFSGPDSDGAPFTDDPVSEDH
jgi:hypothetical protein